jgi:hypothetical protein
MTKTTAMGEKAKSHLTKSMSVMTNPISGKKFHQQPVVIGWTN